MDANGIAYNIVKTYENGVRVGNVPSIGNRYKRSGIGMSWFPKKWSMRDMMRASEHVSRLKKNRGVKDGGIIYGIIYGVYKGVRFGVIKTHGNHKILTWWFSRNALRWPAGWHESC